MSRNNAQHWNPALSGRTSSGSQVQHVQQSFLSTKQASHTFGREEDSLVEMWRSLDSTMGGSQGGGFMDTSASGESKQTQKRGTNIVPLMIGHLTTDSNKEVFLWGSQVNIVSVVGIVKNIDQQSTKISYTVEDETGTIPALKWLELDKSTSEPVIAVNSYVKVHGLLREQQGQRHVLILCISPLQTLNELVNHLLEVTFCTLKAENMKKVSAMDTTDGQNNYGMTQEQLIVYKIIQAQNDTDCGIERGEIKRKVPGNLQAKLSEILDFLTCEGHIYTTSTDDHFKTT